MKKNEKNDNDIIDNDDICIDIMLKKGKIYTDNNNDFKNNMDKLNSKLSQRDEVGRKTKNNKKEEMNSQVKNRSIDKFKDYLENKYNGLGILNKNVK